MLFRSREYATVRCTLCDRDLARSIHWFIRRRRQSRLQRWITHVREVDLPHMHSFTRGLDPDIQAVSAALKLLFQTGRTEGVDPRPK
jgi:transposase